MWYLHNHFVCARLLALCAIAAPSFLAISDLNNRYARRKDLICKAKSILHPHSGWFHVSRASRAQQAKALKKQSLRSQIATSKTVEGRDGRRYLPRVFTEQGVAMLSAVLRSDTAIKVSVKIMNAFVEMRCFIADNAHMFEQIRNIDHRLDSLERSTNERFKRIFDYMETHKSPSQKVFFEGQVYDAFELLISLVQRAKHEIVLANGYVDTRTLNILSKKNLSVAITVWTRPKTSLTEGDVATFNVQYPVLVVKHTISFHDRFLTLDGVEGYLIGASLKDAGKKSFAITKLGDSSIVESIVAALGE